MAVRSGPLAVQESIMIALEFENQAKNVADMLKFGREKKMKIVHVRAVYNENVSPWIKNFRVMNPEKWDCIIDNDCTEDFAQHQADEIGRFSQSVCLSQYRFRV